MANVAAATCCGQLGFEQNVALKVVRPLGVHQPTGERMELMTMHKRQRRFLLMVSIALVAVASALGCTGSGNEGELIGSGIQAALGQGKDLMLKVNLENIVAFFVLSYGVCWLFGSLAKFSQTGPDEAQTNREQLENGGA